MFPKPALTWGKSQNTHCKSRFNKRLPFKLEGGPKTKNLPWLLLNWSSWSSKTSVADYQSSRIYTSADFHLQDYVFFSMQAKIRLIVSEKYFSYKKIAYISILAHWKYNEKSFIILSRDYLATNAICQETEYSLHALVYTIHVDISWFTPSVRHWK